MDKKNIILEGIRTLFPQEKMITAVYSGAEQGLSQIAAVCGKVFYLSEQKNTGIDNVTCFTIGDGTLSIESVDVIINYDDESIYNSNAGNLNMDCYKLAQLLIPGGFMISAVKETVGEEVIAKVKKAHKDAGLLETTTKTMEGFAIVVSIRARNAEEKKNEVYGIWDAWAPNYNEYHKNELIAENLDLWRSVLKNVVAAPTGSKTLDIGTGTGFLSLMAAEIGFDSYGIDLSEQMLSFAKKHMEERNVSVTLIHGDGDRLPFEDNSFSAVMNSRVLWTCIDPVESIHEWMRVAKAGGRIISFARTGEDRKSDNSMVDSMLPMSHAVAADYVKVYEQAGLKNITCEKLSEEMSVLEGPVWYVIVGEKE